MQQPGHFCQLRATALDTTRQPTRDLIERLRERGHHAHREPAFTARGGALFALREACATMLTAIEAIDPVTQTMIEELRLEVEKRLRLSDTKETR